METILPYFTLVKNENLCSSKMTNFSYASEWVTVYALGNKKNELIRSPFYSSVTS